MSVNSSKTLPMVRMKVILPPGLLLVIALLLGSCSGNRRTDADISGVSLPAVTIHRYDLDLFRVDPGNLQHDLEVIKPGYLFFLDTDLRDTSKLNGMKAYLLNPRSRDFHKAVKEQYSDISRLEKDLTEAFRHYRYYFPQARIPRVYAYISGGDYDYPVRFVDSVILIGLDNYLGKDFKPYSADGLPYYRMERMTPDNILPDCMRALAKDIGTAPVPGNNLLEQMVEAGKRLWFIDAMIPSASDRLKIGYPEQQYNWIVKNEEHVWATMIENRMLYTTDGKLVRTFMTDGPFTAEFSKEAPPRLGEWIGWQIVRKYMEKQPSVTLTELLKERDAQKILNLSGYKPDK